MRLLTRMRRWIRRIDRRWIRDTTERERHAALVRHRLRLSKDASEGTDREVR